MTIQTETKTDDNDFDWGRLGRAIIWMIVIAAVLAGILYIAFGLSAFG